MELEPIVNAIQRAQQMSDLAALLRDWRDDSGLSHLVYHAVDVPTCDRPNPVLLLTYDPVWVKRYVEQDYFSLDPVVMSGRKGFLPIDWMNVDHTSTAAKHFFAEAESHGVGRHGFTLPIRGLHGERALFTITSNDTDEQWHRRRFAHLADFHLAAHYLHDRAMQLAGYRSAPFQRAAVAARTPMSEGAGGRAGDTTGRGEAQHILERGASVFALRPNQAGLRDNRTVDRQGRSFRLDRAWRF